MAKTSVDLDGTLLKTAQEILGTTSKRDTITTALQEVVSRDAHRHIVDWVANGKGTDLANDEIMNEAWH